MVILYWLQSGVGVIVGVAVIVGVDVGVEVGKLTEIPLWQSSSKTRSTEVAPCTGSATGLNKAT